MWVGVSVDKFWTAFCQALGLEEMMTDPRYANDKARRQNRDELNTRVSEICKQYRSTELEELLVAAGVPCARLATVAEVEENPQVKLRRLIEGWDYPGKGKVKIVQSPMMIDGRFPETRIQAPQLGQHTAEILREIGYNEEEIQSLLDKGIAVQYKP